MASPWKPSPLPQPNNPEALARTWDGYRQTLLTMARRPDGIRLLLEHLTTINSQLQAERERQMALVTSAPLSAYISNLDQLVLRSTPRERQSRSPRDRAAPASPRSPQPSPLDLLSRSNRLGPRLAAKLVAASARAEANRRKELPPP